MPVPEPASHARLEAMGITVWASRVRLVGASLAAEPRIRLSSGEGAWLLVQRHPWDGRHADLLADITALVGAAHCRFGQWAGGSEAGVAVSELASRGISTVIAFGPLPEIQEMQLLVRAASLEELAASAEARRSLWQVLRPRLVA